MRFLTEQDMRQIYEKSPFKFYSEEEGVRLTPGGRQYLLDRGVKFQNLINKKEPTNIFEQKTSSLQNVENITSKVLKTIRAQILVIASELSDLNVDVAEELFKLENNLKKFISTNDYSNLCCIATKCNFTLKENDLDCMCFQFDSSYVKAKNGKEIAKLYYLICTLEEKLTLDDEVLNKAINCIIGKLMQLTCQLYRSSECQKKI